MRPPRIRGLLNSGGEKKRGSGLNTSKTQPIVLGYESNTRKGGKCAVSPKPRLPHPMIITHQLVLEIILFFSVGLN